MGGIRLPVDVVVGGSTAPPPSGSDDIIFEEERLLFEPSRESSELYPSILLEEER